MPINEIMKAIYKRREFMEGNSATLKYKKTKIYCQIIETNLNILLIIRMTTKTLYLKIQCANNSIY